MRHDALVEIDVDTSVVGRMRAAGPGRGPDLLMGHYVVAVLVSIVLGVSLGRVWLVLIPITAVLHVTIVLATGPRRRRWTDLLDRETERLVARGRAAGVSELDPVAVRRMLAADDNGPMPWTGEKGPVRPLLEWSVGTSDACVVAVRTVEGQREVTTLRPESGRPWWLNI